MKRQKSRCTPCGDAEGPVLLQGRKGEAAFFTHLIEKRNNWAFAKGILDNTL
jgi:hypothetical protein